MVAALGPAVPLGAVTVLCGAAPPVVRAGVMAVGPAWSALSAAACPM